VKPLTGGKTLTGPSVLPPSRVGNGQGLRSPLDPRRPSETGGRCVLTDPKPWISRLFIELNYSIENYKDSSLETLQTYSFSIDLSQVS
jgi:hypothetical protein